MLSWHYDMKIETQGIRFILFGIWTVYVLRAENIEYTPQKLNVFHRGYEIPITSRTDFSHPAL
jgi:hypothetical protein